MIVHATNGLDGGVGTALHTHGQFFNGSTWFDGAVQTTQCPIPPGQTLSYEINTSLQTGTYWRVVSCMATHSTLIDLGSTAIMRGSTPMDFERVS